MPATCSAASSPATSPTSASTSTSGLSGRRSRVQGDAEPELQEVRIELPVDAHLPHDYIPSERLRLEIYKRLAEVRSDGDVDLILEELVDRYGEPPQEVSSLLLVARFRARARSAGIAEVTIAGKNVRFAPVSLPESRVVRLMRMYPGASSRHSPTRSSCRAPRRPWWVASRSMGWLCLNGRARSSTR